MNSLKLAEKRHSVREYKHKKLNEQDRNFLNVQFIDKPILSGDHSVEFVFIENGLEVSPQIGRASCRERV